MKLPIKILDTRLNEFPLTYATEGSVGFDLRACIDSPYNISPGETYKISAGFATAVPPGYGMFVIPRSGKGSQGLVLGNGTGLIDIDYRGQVHIPIWNRTFGEIFKIEPMKRIVQAYIAPIVQVQFEVVDDLEETARGEGGFGHSGHL